MAGFFFTGEETAALSPDTVARKRRLLEALQQEATSTAPVQHWSQGAARLVNALANNVEERRLNDTEKAGNKRVAEFLAGQLGAGASPAVAPAAAGGVASPPAAAPAPSPAGAGASVSRETGQVGSRLAADLQRDFGLSPEQSAGVVGNLAHESGNFRTLQEIRPTVPGSRGGYGYAQWTGPRRVAFEQWSKANNLDPTSYEANYGFLKHELQNTGEGKVLAALKSAPDVGAATQVFSNQFLRPGIPAMDSRLRYAQQYAGGASMPAPGAQEAQNLQRPAPGQFNVPGQQQAPQTPAASPGINPRLAAALSDPWLSKNPIVQQLIAAQIGKNPLQEQMLRLQIQEKQQSLANPSAEWGVISEDENGKRYGWIDKRARTVAAPPGASQPAAPQQVNIPGVGTVTRPQGKEAGKAFDKEVGDRQAKAILDAPAAIARGQESLATIDKLIGSPDGKVKEHPGFKSSFGFNTYFLTRRGSDTANAESILGTIKGKAFLQAFESLKGGGAITQVEGEKATEAIAALGREQSPEAARESLKELRGIIQRGLERARAMGQQPGSPAPAAPKASDGWTEVQPGVRIREM